MFKRLTAAFILLAILLTSVSTPALANNPASAPAEDLPSAETKNKTEILVRFKDTVTVAGRDRLAKDQGGQVVDELPQIKVHVIRVPEQAAARVLSALQKNPNVEFAEANGSYELARTPNDPYYPSQWGLSKMRAPYAWDATVGSTSVIVAVIDSGVDIYHPDLSGKIVKPYNAADRTTNVTDSKKHGTGVASAIAATSSNSRGLAGMCWSCKIMPIKVFTGTGGASYDYIARGIIYAADNGAKVINMSLGGGGFSGVADEAIKYARSKGVVVIAAAGNTGSSAVNYPGGFAGVISVAGIQSNNYRYSWSAYGSWVDVSAPGCGIVALTDGGYSTNNTWCGTSYAAPLVAGVAGLIRSRYPNSSAAAVEAAIVNTTSAIVSGTSAKGMVNAQSAVSHSMLSSPVVKAISPSQWANLRSVKPTITGTFSRTVRNVSASTVLLRQHGTTSNIPATVTWNSSTLQATITPSANLKAGTSYAVLFTSGITDTLSTKLTPYTLYFTTSWSANSADAKFSPARTVKFSAGTHVGYRFTGSGAVATSKTISLSAVTSATTGFRTAIKGQSGGWIYMSSGSLNGWFVRETAGARYIAGSYAQSSFPAKYLKFNAGTYTGYKYYSSGSISASKKMTLSSASSAYTTSEAIINGRWHYYVSNGGWAGYWMPLTGGVSLGTNVDVTKPVISARTPAVNATKVALTAPVTLTFSEPVSGVSASSITVTNSAGAKLAITVSYDAVARKATISHPGFAQLTNYTVSASAAIKDATGNTLTATAWSFTTADTTAPTVSGFSPAHNSTAVSAAIVLSATFSEPVTGVSASSVSLINVDTGLTVPATVGYGATTRKVTIAPTSLLHYSSNFRVYFNGAAIKDAAGNLLSVPTWSFTVQDDPIP
jgi:thermitase